MPKKIKRLESNFEHHLILNHTPVPVMQTLKSTQILMLKELKDPIKSLLQVQYRLKAFCIPIELKGSWAGLAFLSFKGS